MYKTKNNLKSPAKGLQKQTNFHHKKFTSKVMHGYFNRTIEKDQKIDHTTSKSWTKNRKLTSHFEGYIADIQEQEIETKYLIKHIISSCPLMPARYYLPVRHDMVAKTLYKEIIKKTTQKL